MDKRTSQLDPAGPLTGVELFPVVQNGVTKRSGIDAILTWILGTIDSDNITEGSTNLFLTQTNFDTFWDAKALGDISDVDLTGLNPGDVLSYNGTDWVPYTLTSPTTLYSGDDSISNDRTVGLGAFYLNFDTSSGGKVGFGTVPDSTVHIKNISGTPPLHVQSFTNSTFLKIHTTGTISVNNSTPTTTDTLVIRQVTSGGASITLRDVGGSDMYKLGVNNSSGEVKYNTLNSTYYHSFFVNSIEKARITSAGIIVGGATAEADFHVAGSLKFVTGNEGSGKVLTSDALGNADWVTPTVGATVFTGLNDVPNSYVGEALKYVRVNAGETGLEFETFPTIPVVSGTTNYVAKFTGATSVGDSQIQDNVTVGIGSAPTISMLTVTKDENALNHTIRAVNENAGNAAGASFSAYASGGKMYVGVLGDGNSTSAAFGGAGSVFFRKDDTTNAPINYINELGGYSWYTNSDATGSAKMVILSNGKVGINELVPTSNIQIKTSLGGSGLGVYQNDGTTSVIHTLDSGKIVIGGTSPTTPTGVEANLTIRGSLLTNGIGFVDPSTTSFGSIRYNGYAKFLLSDSLFSTGIATGGTAQAGNIKFYTLDLDHTIGQVERSGVNVKWAFGYDLTTPTATVDIAANTTSQAQLRFRTGVAPTSPNDGDIWFDGTDLKMRVGGVTKTFTLV